MSNIIQVTNIAATVTDDNIKTLFGFVGPIREMIMYFESSQQEETKVAYVVFESNSDAETSLHLHNTVFHDRALIVLPLAESCKAQIPDLSYATIVRAPEKTVTGITPKSKLWPSDVLSMVVGRTGEQSIVTIEPNFTKQELPNYPNLPYSTEVAKIDEIRRTVLVTNLDTGTTLQQVLDFFQPVAEVKFIRMAGSEHDNAAYVEFTEQGSVAKAFGMMGSKMANKPVMIQHSNVAINKPTSNHRTSGTAASDVKGSISKSRSVSRVKKRSRSRKRSKSVRRQSGSKSRRRSGSRLRRKSRSRRRSRSRRGGGSKGRRSRSRRGSKTRSQRRSRSRHRRERKRSVSKGKDRRKRSGSRERKRDDSRSRRRGSGGGGGGKRSKSRHSSRDKDKKVVVKREKKEEVDNGRDGGEDKKPKERRHHRSERDKEERKRRHSSRDKVKKEETKVKVEKSTENGNERRRSSSEEAIKRAAALASLHSRTAAAIKAAESAESADVSHDNNDANDAVDV